MAIGQDNHCPRIERDLGIEFDKWDCPVLDEGTLQSDNLAVFLVVTVHLDRKTSFGLRPMSSRGDQYSLALPREGSEADRPRGR